MVEEFSISKIEKGLNKQLLALKRQDHLSLSKDKPIILFGSGVWGKLYLQIIKGRSTLPILFCDNNPQKWGTVVEGVPVISFNELKNRYRDSYIVIASLNYYDEILKLLIDSNIQENLLRAAIDVLFDDNYSNYFGLVNNNIDGFTAVYNMLSDDYSKKVFYDRINYCISADSKYLIPVRSKANQYFEPNIISLTRDEIFIDGGAYTGDTVEEFIKQVKGNFKKVYSFEPDKSKHMIFLKKFSANLDIELLPYGLWSERGTLRFNIIDNGGSNINNGGEMQVPVTSIDDVLNGLPATFVKMDVEGSELEALKGAENTIKKYKPKLAICVYHKPLDIIEIPNYIKKLVPQYKLYLRHYSASYLETVLYAVPE